MNTKHLCIKRNVISNNDYNIDILDHPKKSNPNLLKDITFDDLEALITDEPTNTKYETVKYHRLNIFPYFLVGKIISKFEIGSHTLFLNGVGILIGPEIVLTVAHILLHESEKEGEYVEPKKVYFFPVANGDFNPFEDIKSLKVVVNSDYILALKNDDKLSQLSNDWGLIYLNSSVGSQITALFAVEEEYETDLMLSEDRLYNYFCKNENMEINNDLLGMEKLSIIGYTEFKTNYLESAHYRFKHNFFTASDGDITNVKESTEIKPVKRNSDKKIKININVNTSNSNEMSGGDIMTEGLATKSRNFVETPDRIKRVKSKYLKLNPSNGSDFIVFGKEEFNKNFDKTDADKLIMSESKGTLIENEEKCIKYIISTYKGQSGSPVFMRVKSRNFSSNSFDSTIEDHFSEDERKHVFTYSFIGLHSRRGTLENKKVKFRHPGSTIETKKSNESCFTCKTFKTVSSNDESSLETKRILQKNGQVHNLEDKNEKEMIKKINIESTKEMIKEIKDDEISKTHGFSDYNAALNLIGNATKEIIKVIREQNAILTKQKKHRNFMTPESDFISVKITLAEDEKLCGLFKKSTHLNILFEFGAAVLNIPKDYILLKERLNQNLSDIIQNYNYDMNKQINDLLENEDSINLEFELMLNIKKYGEMIAKKLYDKFLSSYFVEKDEFKRLFEKKYSKKYFQLVFLEISMFENIYPLYGLLFNKIKQVIMVLVQSQS